MKTEVAVKELRSAGIIVEENISLANHSSFKIGGECDIAVFPASREELRTSLTILKNNGVRYDVIGRASNILFADSGYRGALIFTNKMNEIILNDDGSIYAGAGATLKSIANLAQKNALSGFEFAHGIPGSCGGGVFMNAGAYGGEISDVLVYSDYYNVRTDEFGRLLRDEHNFSYRHSIYEERKELILTGACFAFSSGDRGKIKSVMDENAQKRKDKQPLEYPNAGSTFKRPPNGFAAQMIDECSLKGLSVGGAQVSEKHAGFIVNKGGASASDVMELVDIVKQTVKERFDIELELEIRYIE